MSTTSVNGSEAPMAQQRPVEAVRLPPQQAPSPLVFGKHVLARLRADRLQVWDTRTWAESSLALDDPKGIGVMADGRLLVVEQPEDLSGNARLRRIDGEHAESSTGFLNLGFAGLSHVFAGARSDEVIVVTGGTRGSLDRVPFVPDGTFFATSHSTLTAGEAQVVAGLPDGRTVHFHSESLVVLGPGESLARYPLPDGLSPPAHLAAGPDPDSVWVATAQGQVALVQLGQPAQVRAAYTPAGGMAYDLASAGDAVAVLLLDQAHGGFAWTLVQLDARRGERWRQRLPDPERPTDTWVAASGALVAVGGSDSLAAWDAATGAPQYPVADPG